MVTIVVRTINDLLSYCRVPKSLFWKAQVLHAASGFFDFYLLAFTGFLIAGKADDHFQMLGGYFTYSSILATYLFSILVRILYSFISYKHLLNVIFGIRLKLSTRFINKEIRNDGSRRQEDSSNVLLSYLNEFCFSVSLPLATLLTEVFIISVTFLFAIYLYGGVVFVLLAAISFALLPVWHLVNKSKEFGAQKVSVEKFIFKEIDCYLDSAAEVIQLRIKKAILRKIYIKLREWMFLVRRQLFYNNLPKLYFENVAYVVTAAIFLGAFIADDAYISGAPILVVLVPLLRTVPAFARISSAVQQIKYGLPHIASLAELRHNNVKFPFNSFGGDSEVLVSVTGNLQVGQRVVPVINFRLNRGGFAQITGKSGSGKSTFIKCLLSGYTASDLKILWYSGVGAADVVYLPDRPLIVNGSVKENILLGVRDYEEGRFRKALAVCGFFEAEMIELLDSHCDFDGRNISTGQRQRIGLARAVYREPKILIIDEGISNIPKNERDSIIEAIVSLGCAIIIVDHGKVYSVKSCEVWQMTSSGLLRR